MANSKIYLGSTNIGSLFQGADDISIYLGENKVYPLEEPFKWKAILSNGTTQSGVCTSSTVLNSYELPSSTVILEVGDCVSEINSSLYSEKNSLTAATISDSVTKVGVRTFYACTNLITVEIGSGVTSIGDWFVNGCTRLQSVKITATTPPRLGTACFTNSNDCSIYVPSQSVQAYKTASGWNMYASRIQATP